MLKEIDVEHATCSAPVIDTPVTAATTIVATAAAAATASTTVAASNEPINSTSAITTTTTVQSKQPPTITCTPTSNSRKIKDEPDPLGSQKVFKKTSPNSMLTLYLGSRELISRRGIVEPLRGVLYVDPKFVAGHRIYGQLTLTFRYGREDEEVMGLKFCNEAVIAIKQIYPKPNLDTENVTPLQEALLERLGKGAHAFSIEIGTLAPPSVQLVPAKRYNGAPIGTSYDIRVFLADQSDEKLQRRSMVKLGIRLIHKICPNMKIPSQEFQQTSTTTSTTAQAMQKTLRLRLSPKALKISNKLVGLGTSKSDVSCNSSNGESSTTGCCSITTGNNTNNNNNNNNNSNSGGGTTSHLEDGKMMTTDTNVAAADGNFTSLKGPQGYVDKPFLWAEGRVSLNAALNKSAYGHGEYVYITINVRNDSRKIVRKIRIFAVQHVDVCMFSNGKFKNVVADLYINNQIGPNETSYNTYSLLPAKGSTKNWIAIEGALFNSSADQYLSTLNAKIASSAPRGPQTNEERNVFAIYVSYYVKVKLTLSGMGGELSLKLPFILGHVDDGNDYKNDNKNCCIIKEESSLAEENTIINSTETILMATASQTTNGNLNKKSNQITNRDIDDDGDDVICTIDNDIENFNTIKNIELSKINKNLCIENDDETRNVEIIKKNDVMNVITAQIHREKSDDNET